MFVVADPERGRAAVVDPGMASEPILTYLESNGLVLDYIINTHGHFDHIFNNGRFKKSSQAKLLVHPGDAPMLDGLVRSSLRWGVQVEPSPPPDGPLEDGQEILVGEVPIRVLHTPGHTPGSVCLYVDGAVLAGDTLFAGSIGRTDGPDGSLRSLLESVRSKLFVLPDETVVYPGHGPISTIGEERRANPFFQPGAEGWLPGLR